MASFSNDLLVLRNAFASGRTRSLSFREQQLRNLLRLYEEHNDDILVALGKDLRKHKQEAMVEVTSVISRVKHALEHLHDWAKTEKPSKAFLNLLDDVMIVNDPYGVVLIIGAWNYPIDLTFSPAIAAIAAGNCVILKPSEISPASASLTARLVPEYLDKECYKVVVGGPEHTEELLKNRFDYIFFTGSPKIGKLIHAAASKFLTPTTLELGGKSPVVLDGTANMDVAARRILWGKCTNVGQTCVAPDYILCEKEVGENFINVARKILTEWYGDDAQKSSDYGRVINYGNFKRLQNLLDKSKIVVGGRTDESDRYIEPTVMENVKPDDPIMMEEIFGPILPLMYVNDVHEAVEYINANEKPLSLYIFSENQDVIDLLLRSTSSGGICVNDTLVHYAVQNIPFGGVGNSGMGAYHGKFGFDTFVHKKSVLVKSLNKVVESMNWPRYPPYSDAKIKSFNWIMGTTWHPF